jgi:hypothetical protein
MKEPYGKGLATHPNPESCADHGNMTGEALTRAHAGQPLGNDAKGSGNDAKGSEKAPVKTGKE